MIESKMFFDTNLLVYLYSTDPKALIVERLIQSHFDEICLSVVVRRMIWNALRHNQAYQVVIVCQTFFLYCENICFLVFYTRQVEYHQNETE